MIIPLMVAMLACSLSSGNDTQNTVPTSVPTSVLTPVTQAVGQVATATTSTSSATTAPVATARPNCTPRTDWPVYRVQQGDTLSTIAQRVGSTVDGLTQANCLANSNLLSVGQALYVPVIPPAITPTATLSCANNWFFNFNAGKRPNTCPAQVLTGASVGQDFEGGRVVVYPIDWNGNYVESIYVIYNDGSWDTFNATWEVGEPESDASIVPPAGRFQPVHDIGEFWRTEPGVRAKLGWAYAPEAPFVGRWQGGNANIAIAHPGYPIYLDLGARNTVVLLMSRPIGSG